MLGFNYRQVGYIVFVVQVAWNADYQGHTVTFCLTLGGDPIAFGSSTRINRPPLGTMPPLSACAASPNGLADRGVGMLMREVVL
jgi:hypothetical protein